MPDPPVHRPPGPDPLPLPSRRPLGGLLNVVLAVLIVAVVVVAAVTLLTGDETVTVPDLVGRSLSEAEATAESVGLTLEVTATDGSARVVAQDPSAGTVVTKGSGVEVTVALPEVTVTVPDVLGMSTTDARQALEAAGLHVGALHADPSSRAAAGSVSRQSPDPGATNPAGSTVDLWLAESSNIQVPDLSGLSQAEADAAARRAGLTLQVLTEVTDEVLPGQVFRQSPKAGAQVVPGSVVAVVVNGAPGASAPDTGTQVATTTPVPVQGEPASGEPPGTGGVTVPVPAVYEALAAAFPFPVLYPATTGGLVIDPAAGNPRQVTDQGGSLAFEVRYIDGARPGAGLRLIEGGFFELGIDEATTVDVRGYPASLGATGTSVVLSWQEGPTPYMIAAEGLDAAQVVAFAGGLIPVPGS